MTMIGHRLAWLATALAGVAAVLGLLTPVYRDVPAMVDQAQGTDLATLFGAVPLLLIAFRLMSRGSALGPVIAGGGLGYLAYTYAIYAFQVVVNPLTPIHIAILGLAVWSLLLLVPAARRSTAAVGRSLPRRTTAGFLLFVVVMFGGLWLSQIGSAITSGHLPAAVTDLHLPTSAVYALDLAFALPVLALAGVLLVRRHPLAGSLAIGGLVFVVLMALSILGLFAVQAARGSLTDASMVVVFALVGLIGGGLALRGVGPAGPPVQRRLAHVPGD